MDDARKDDLLLEILDRLGRVEEKLDTHIETRQRANEALDMSQHNEYEIGEIKRRLDANDSKWETDRKEKRTMWLTVIGIAGTFLASIGTAIITILFS